MNKILANEYKPEFQYVINESLHYDKETQILSGNYRFHDSAYLQAPDKIMNVEDATFLLFQSMYFLISAYYLHEKQIDSTVFQNQLLQNLMVTKTDFAFNNYIVKNEDGNTFYTQLLSIKIDSSDRLWFRCFFSMSQDKFTATYEGCVYNKNLHKDAE